MKSRTLILGCVIGVLALSMVYDHSTAQQNTDTAPVKIGVVSIREVFRDSAKNAAYRNAVINEQSKLNQELDELTKELQAEEAALSTLKAGTPDHLEQVKAALTKRAQLDARREYTTQARVARDKLWTEALFQAVLQIVDDLAQEKRLTLVLERTEPIFPQAREELMMTLNTHKTLYSGGCIDLTKETTERLDKLEDLKPAGLSTQ